MSYDIRLTDPAMKQWKPAPLTWAEIDNPLAPVNASTWRHLTAPLLALTSVDHGRWHMSVSHRDRIPTWTELGDARDALLPPDLFFMLPHPPRRYWLNLDHRVLHLWEMNDPKLVEQFRWEGEQAQAAGYGTPTRD